MLELLIAILLGILAGIITGLAPGVHINLIATILLSLAPTIGQHAPLILICITIVAMAITHTFLDTLPSIFLGAPEDDKALGVLPGHRYLLRGNGLMAIKLCVVGGVFGTLLSILFFIPSIWIIAFFAQWSAPYLFWIILAFALFSTFKDEKPVWAAIIFCLSGTLGTITLHLPLKEPLLPLLSGMFGIATLLYSINENQHIPEQHERATIDLDVKKTILGTILGAIAGMLTAIYPGISASTASALASRGTTLGDHGFLILLGSLGSASFLLSLAAWLGIEKARNGAMAVIVQLTPTTSGVVVMLLGTALIATGAAALLTLRMGASAATWLPRIPYRSTCIGVICFVAAIVFVRSGLLGILVLATSTSIGLLPAALKTARGQAMGCLLLPLLVMLW